MFGIRLPRALTAAFIDQALKASEGVAGLSVAMRGLIAARTAVMTAVAAIDADMRRMTRASAACSRLMTIPGVGQLTALAFVAAIDDPSGIRRSRDVGAYLGLVPRRYQSRGRRCWLHLEMRRSAHANAPLPGRQCHADPLQGPTQGLGFRDRQAINDAKGESRRARRLAIIMHANGARRDRVRIGLSPAIHKTGGRIQLPRGATP